MTLGSTNGIALANAGALHPAGDPTAKAAQNPLLNSPTAQFQRRIKWGNRVNAGLLVALILSVCGNVFGSLRIVKYPVIYDRDTAGTLTPMLFDPHKPVEVRAIDIQATTEALVENVRKAGMDEKAYGDQWNKARTFLTSKTTKMMVPLINERIVWIRKGGTIEYQKVSYLPMAGTDGKIVQLEWTERHVQKNGVVKPGGEQVWKATFKLHVVKADPTTMTRPAQLKNPLGIFVEDYTWEQKEIK